MSDFLPTVLPNAVFFLDLSTRFHYSIVIATSTNLIQRQGLSIIERGFAYKALLDAKNRHGQWYIDATETLGENRQKFGEGSAQTADGRQRYNARKLVAEFFGVTEYEIRKAVKLTQLIPELSNILEESPKQLNLACADLIADYDAESQKPFIEIWNLRISLAFAQSAAVP